MQAYPFTHHTYTYYVQPQLPGYIMHFSLKPIICEVSPTEISDHQN